MNTESFRGKRMKALVIGANGQLGWELCRRAPRRGFDVVPLDLPLFDITDPSCVKKETWWKDVDMVINAAAYTAVDKAESEPDLAFAVNRDGPFYVAESCSQAGSPLVHISTDFVFGGEKDGPYRETDPVNPVNVYGKSKAEGEKKIRERLSEHVIIRTSWLYGVHGNNFVRTMLKLGKERETLRVVNDQYGCPTYAADVADAIMCIAEHILGGKSTAWGTYHYCGRGATTWHRFADAVFDLARRYDALAVKKVEAILTSEYPTPARRPANSVLDCSLIEKTFSLARKPWTESLAVMISRYYQESPNRQQANVSQ